MFTKDKPLMAFDPKRLDPASAHAARELLAEFKRPNGEIVLNLQRSSRLEQAIEEAIHNAKVSK
jgi:anti-sigma regulatory factor (Ser/Thr protein kinase)